MSEVPYEVPFGLKRQPFRAAASGADVFVGPQTAKVMQSTKKALTSPDAVVAVIGPAGTGKTTLVKRALGTISGDKQVVHVARMHLGHDEVLEMLLEAVGATDIPASTLKQFRLFQRLCVEKASAGIRTIVLVEDALRIGEDALAELEAITAADGLDNGGANLVLMGDPSLGKLLHTEPLERLRQRLRLYQKVQPLAAAEMQGYLKHCFRMAGGEFDLLFDEQAGTFFHALSAGIPRIVNNLVDSVLAAAAEDGLERIDLECIRRVAEEQYGLTADLPGTPAKTDAPPKSDAASAPHAKRQPAKPDPADTPHAARATGTKAKAAPQESAASTAAPAEGRAAPAATPPGKPGAPAPERGSQAAATPPQPDAPPTAHAADTEEASNGADEALELVQDTLPDLAVLAPEMAGSADRQPATDGDEIPTLFSSQTVDTGKVTESSSTRPADRPKPARAANAADSAPPSRPKQDRPATAAAARPAASKQDPATKPPAAAAAAGQDRLPKTAQAKTGTSPTPEHAADGSHGKPARHTSQAQPAKAANAEAAPPPARRPAASSAAAKPAAPSRQAQRGQRAGSAPGAGTQPGSKAGPAAPQAKTGRNGEKAAAPAAAKAEAPAARGKAANTAAAPKKAPARKNVPSSDGAAAAGRPAAAAGREDDKPAWERDPTLAQLRPDFDALDQAMAEFAESDAETPAPAPPAEPEATQKAAAGKHDPTVPAVPEITLDSAIEERIAEASAARDRKDGPRPGDDVPIEAAVEKRDPATAPATNTGAPAGAPGPSAEESTRADEELERIAAGLARARTIEDVDDKMAETLFGEEFSAIAAQIAANPPPEYLEAMAESSQPEGEKAAPAAPPAADQKPPDDEPKTDMEREFMEVYGEEAVNVDLGAEEPRAGLDLSASQRLATVRALNADGSPDANNPSTAQKDAAPPGPPPAPIEDQITTSLTQTMRTLNPTPPPANDDDDEDDKKGGFFRRFRRS